MPLLSDPEDVLAAFKQLPQQPSKEELQAFVKAHFAKEGLELKEWIPPDWVPQPDRLSKIQNATLHKWAMELHTFWKNLSRSQDPVVAQAPQRYTAIVRRFGMVIPGGRFRETYYWDTYWILRGLLVSGMVETARGMVENLLDDVRNLGFVPNGGRIYYLDRSQPPLLLEMVLAIHEAVHDSKWLAEVLPVLEREYRSWMDPAKGHVVTMPTALGGSRRVLNRYYSGLGKARPESYREDIETSARSRALGRSDEDLFRGLRSAAETGWDFSSRWLAVSESGQVDLATVNASSVLPVDLNCFLYRVELGLARIRLELKLPGVAAYLQGAHDRKSAMDALLWDAPAGHYKDFDLDTHAHSKVVSISDFSTPLWAGLAGPRTGQAMYSKGVAGMIKALTASGLLQPGGASTTTLRTKQQWDAPNAWAPLQHLLIEGLDAAAQERVPGAQELADHLANQWLENCLLTYKNTGFMHEKYDAFEPGSGGGGGEYTPQIGFGWSNGVVLALLDRDVKRTKSQAILM